MATSKLEKEIYEKLSTVIDEQSNRSRAYVLEIVYVLKKIKTHPLASAAFMIKDLKLHSKKYRKHLKNQIFTDKWEKTREDLKDAHVNAFFKVCMSINAAHTFQTTLFKFLVAADMIKGQPNIDYSILETVSASYTQLLRLINRYDSDDRTRLSLFNKFRNVLFHTPIEKLAILMSDEEFDELEQLCSEINTINVMFLNSYQEELLAVFEHEQKFCFTDDNESNDEYEEKNNILSA